VKSIAADNTSAIPPSTNMKNGSLAGRMTVPRPLITSITACICTIPGGIND